MPVSMAPRTAADGLVITRTLINVSKLLGITVFFFFKTHMTLQSWNLQYGPKVYGEVKLFIVTIVWVGAFLVEEIKQNIHPSEREKKKKKKQTLSIFPSYHGLDQALNDCLMNPT